MVKIGSPSRRRLRFRGGPFDGEMWHRLRVATAVLAAVIAVGTLGYLLLGLSLLDALYQTVITVSTVGFRELGEVSTTYKIFSIILIMLGAGSVLYTLGVFLETLVEGRLTKEFGRRRMVQDIENLQDHIVVCGWGQVGQAITRTLVKEGNSVVVIDQDENIVDSHEFFVVGDATDDAVLETAGIRRASALVVALNNAPANVYVTLSGRAAEPDLFIVARAITSSGVKKLHQAGANRVVNPHELGGANMAALVTQPNVAEFLDIAMHDRELNISITEIQIPSGSPIDKKPMRDCGPSGVTILAVRKRDGDFIHHPDKDAMLREGDVVIALGTDEAHQELRRMASA